MLKTVVAALLFALVGSVANAETKISVFVVPDNEANEFIVYARIMDWTVPAEWEPTDPGDTVRGLAGFAFDLYTSEGLDLESMEVTAPVVYVYGVPVYGFTTTYVGGTPDGLGWRVGAGQDTRQPSSVIEWVGAPWYTMEIARGSYSGSGTLMLYPGRIYSWRDYYVSAFTCLYGPDTGFDNPRKVDSHFLEEVPGTLVGLE